MLPPSIKQINSGGGDAKKNFDINKIIKIV